MEFPHGVPLLVACYASRFWAYCSPSGDPIAIVFIGGCIWRTASVVVGWYSVSIDHHCCRRGCGDGVVVAFRVRSRASSLSAPGVVPDYAVGVSAGCLSTDESMGGGLVERGGGGHRSVACGDCSVFHKHNFFKEGYVMHSVNDEEIRIVENIGYDVEHAKLTMTVELRKKSRAFRAQMLSYRDDYEHEVATWSGIVGDRTWLDVWNVWLEIQGFGPLTLGSHYGA